jgi:hypothetical protein
LSKWLPHRLLTMDSIEVERLLADEVRLKHWDCTIMFDVAGLEGEHDILQYIKPNALAKDLKLMMECTRNSFHKQYMMCFPEVYSGEMMRVMLIVGCTYNNGQPSKSVRRSAVITKT